MTIRWTMFSLLIIVFLSQFFCQYQLHSKTFNGRSTYPNQVFDQSINERKCDVNYMCGKKEKIGFKKKEKSYFFNK